MQKDLQRLRLPVGTFANAEKRSIDYELYGKSVTVAVLPRKFACSDVGNWASVHAALPHDADGNATGGDAALHESRDSFAFGEGVRVIALGVDDLVIIASADGVYVAPNNRAAEINSLL